MINKYNKNKKIANIKISKYKELSKEEIYDMYMQQVEDNIVLEKRQKMLDESYEKISEEYLRVCDLYNLLYKQSLEIRELKSLKKGATMRKDASIKMMIKLQEQLEKKDEEIEHLNRKNKLFFNRLNKVQEELEDIQRFNQPNIYH